MVMLFRLLCGQSAISLTAAINSASQTLAIAQDGTILDDDVALLQEKMSLKKQDPDARESDEDESEDSEEDDPHALPENPDVDIDLIGHIHEQPFGEREHEMGSYISEDYLHCIEGHWEEVGMQLGIGRATPWSLLYNSHPTEGVTCEERGYTEQLLAEDECFPDASRWTRPGSPHERTHAGIPSGGLWERVFNDYDTSNNYPVGTTRNWVACGICGDDSQLRVAWESDCGDDWRDNVLAVMRSDDIPNGFRSIVPIGGAVCFEGQTDYLERVIANARTTPLADVFEGSEFSTETCTDRGYDVVRDMQDECWPLARKHMRQEHEDIDMINWIGRYASALNSPTPESAAGMWATVDWVSCSCEMGGAVRDRGMWNTMDGGNSAPYTQAYCDAMDFPNYAD